ncbi:18060_t:CDS:10, partial [Funneliformis geosporum]
MNFDDLLGKQRKSEPRVVLIIRIFTLFIISSCIIAYIIILIKEVINEIPAIKTSEVTVDSLAIPDIVFSFGYTFQVYCYFVWTINGFYSRNETDRCTQYITFPKYIEGEYSGYFSLNDQSQYFHSMKLKQNEERLDYLTFLIIVDDPNFNVSMVSFSTLPPYSVIFDSEGIFTGEKEANYYSYMVIKPSSFISYIETEQRSSTYMGIFGVIDGAWGLVVAFYAFLFGASLIHPWGIIQKYCCGIKPITQSKLRESLSILPLTDSSLLDDKDKVEEVSVEEFNRMKEKLKSLEILLREYVIDVKFLQSIDNVNITYMAILINDVKREIPAIKTSEVTVDSLAIPDVLISFDRPFHIYCTFVWNINGFYSRNDSESCMKYITQPTYIGKLYTGYFSLNDQSQYFTPIKTDKECFESLAIVVINDDPNFINKPSLSSIIPFAIIFDSENNPIKLSDGTLDLSKTNMSQSTIDENELLLNNVFALADRMFSLVNFTKYIKRSIIPSWISDIGLFFNHKESAYIKAKFIQGVFVAESERLSGIKVKPDSFINHIETEQITSTYLGMIGVIGGAWGLVVAFYAFLFGASSIHPWGFIQSHCYGIKPKTQSKLRESLSILPLTDSSLHSTTNEISVEERLRSLEILLREYVIDVEYLQRIENKIQVRKDIESCTQYIVSPRYLKGTYRGYFSLNDQSYLFAFSKQNEERLDSLVLTILVDDPKNNPIKLSDGTLDLSMLNISRIIYERELTDNCIIPSWKNNFGMFLNYKESVYIKTKLDRKDISYPIDGIPDDLYFSIAFFRPNSFIDIIEVEQSMIKEISLEEKLKSLEILLREYVIDIKYLQSIENSEIRTENNQN